MLIIYHACLPTSTWNYLEKFYCCYLHTLKYSYRITSPHHGISGYMLLVVIERFTISYEETHRKIQSPT